MAGDPASDPDFQNLLGRVAEITEGRSLRANVALLENNAAVAAEIAVAAAG